MGTDSQNFGIIFQMKKGSVRSFIKIILFHMIINLYSQVYKEAKNISRYFNFVFIFDQLTKKIIWGKI